MTISLKFKHKILIATSLVVITAFTLFGLYNDYLQRNVIRNDLHNHLREMGDVTSNNIQNWFSGRILLVESTAQSISNNSQPDVVDHLLEQKTLNSTFVFSFLGRNDGAFTMRPNAPLPADYDPHPSLV